jgi:hypothetical protein
MRGHLAALDHGGMDPAPARYMIRINGHLGATVLSAFPAMAPPRCATRWPTISSRPRTRHSCSSATSPPSWPPSARWITRSWSRTPSRRSRPSKPFGVPVVHSTVNVATDRDSQPSPTSPAVYQLDHLPSQQEVLAIAEKWRPYRSLATSYLSPPPSSRPGHHRSPDSGAVDHERRLHASGPDPRCHALVLGCVDCLAQGLRDWVHLRVCQECGHVGCCDNSPGRHATAHFHVAGHPVIRSYEPGEDWYWCYLDQLVFELQGAPPAPSHP